MAGEAELLTQDDMAARYHKRPETIRDWRKDRLGPPWLKVGKDVFYRLADVLAWEAARVVDPADAA